MPCRRLGLARRHGIDDAGIVDAVGQDRRAQLGRERQGVVELDAVEIGQALVPVVGVLLHHPDFVLDAALALERSGAGDIDDAAQVVLVVLQRLLAHDAVPAAGDRAHDEGGRPRLRELELHGVLVRRGDLAHRGEQGAARDADARRRLGDTVEGRLDVFRGELGAVVELHVLAQVEGVGLAVLGDLPAMREIGNDGLAAVARVAPDQVVEHAALAAQAVDGAGLMEVEVRRPHGDGVFQHAARLRIRLRRLELELRAVELVGHALRQGEMPWKGGCRPGGGGALDEFTTVYAGTPGLVVLHRASSHLAFSLPSTVCSDGRPSSPKAKSNTTKLWESLA